MTIKELTKSIARQYAEANWESIIASVTESVIDSDVIDLDEVASLIIDCIDVRELNEAIKESVFDLLW